jgi:hypothetical protein
MNMVKEMFTVNNLPYFDKYSNGFPHIAGSAHVDVYEDAQLGFVDDFLYVVGCVASADGEAVAEGFCTMPFSRLERNAVREGILRRADEKAQMSKNNINYDRQSGVLETIKKYKAQVAKRKELAIKNSALKTPSGKEN